MELVISFFKRNFFIFEIMICYIPYVPLLKKDKNTWWKAIIAMAVLVGYSFLPLWRYEGNSEIISNVIAMLSFLTLFILTVVSVKICFKSDIWASILCGISAYLTQHTFFRVRMLTNFFLSQHGINSEWGGYCYYWIELIAVNFLCWIFFSRNLHKRGEFKINNRRLMIVTLVALAVVNFLNTISMFYTFKMQMVPFVAFYLYALLDCLVLLYCLYENIYVKSIEDEVKIVHNLWQEDRKQYELSKQSLDLLNTKIHDLKYQISNYIGDETALKGISKAINLYGPFLRTNNEVLDVILSQSKMICDSKGIQFSCIVDGKLLNGMSAGDLYSLFCNAIDNAIECLDLVEDTEKKSLSIVVKRINEMVAIQIENYMPNEVVFVEGLPQTTKPDKQNHGFGVKSMTYIVKKYGGFINFSAECNVFRVEIILPLNN